MAAEQLLVTEGEDRGALLSVETELGSGGSRLATRAGSAVIRSSRAATPASRTAPIESSTIEDLGSAERDVRQRRTESRPR